MSATLLEQVGKLSAEEQQAVELFIKDLLSKHNVLDNKSLAEKRRRNFGRMKGQIWMADDFNETPEDFKDYM